MRFPRCGRPPQPHASVELAPLPIPTASAPSASAVPVRDITHTVLPQRRSHHVELSREAAYTPSRVANPDRVVFDFTNAAPRPVCRIASRASPAR